MTWRRLFQRLDEFSVAKKPVVMKKPSFPSSNATDGVKSLLNAGQIEKMSPSPERALNTFGNSHADLSPVPKPDSDRKSWTETSRKFDFCDLELIMFYSWTYLLETESICFTKGVEKCHLQRRIMIWKIRADTITQNVTKSCIFVLFLKLLAPKTSLSRVFKQIFFELFCKISLPELSRC